MATSYKQAQKHLADLETVLWLLQSNYLLSARKKLFEVTVRLPLVHWREQALNAYNGLTINCYNHTENAIENKKLVLEHIKSDIQQLIQTMKETA